jgi:O-antigen ligase/polysaccharide polymerase Wzy-like membrane protein
MMTPVNLMAQRISSPDIPGNMLRLGRSSLTYRILFFLLLSGPPRFRLRDPTDSLDSSLDWVVLLQVIVWGIAGCLLFLDTSYEAKAKTADQSRSSLQILTFILIGLLGLSVFFSDAPEFSAFKVYQLGVTVLFIMRFTDRFGIAETLNNLFLGCGILTIADIAAAFLMPELVFFQSELGSPRFRGDLIAQTGCVSVIGLILLLTIKSDLPRIKFIFWAVTFGGVLVFSLMRTSYLILLIFLLLAVIRRPAIPVLRKIATLTLFAVPFVAESLITALNAERKVEDILTVSGRLGLWSHLIETTVNQGPWFGLGYVAASRIFGPEFNADLGTAHSAFIEIYIGGGLLSLVVFLSIWAVLAWKILKLYLSRPGKIGFAIVGLFCAAFFLNGIGGELQADPAGFCLWCVVAAAIYLPFEGLSPAAAPIRSPLNTTDGYLPQEA